MFLSGEQKMTIILRLLKYLNPFRVFSAIKYKNEVSWDEFISNLRTDDRPKFQDFISEIKQHLKNQKVDVSMVAFGSVLNPKDGKPYRDVDIFIYPEKRKDSKTFCRYTMDYFARNHPNLPEKGYTNIGQGFETYFSDDIQHEDGHIVHWRFVYGDLKIHIFTPNRDLGSSWSTTYNFDDVYCLGRARCLQKKFAVLRN